ncbi:aromatic-ring-hydroxylating dioxygenase [Massilia sp. WF1]|uniref:aromatic-ring-hydroxylating dioxygenase subunit beta n=1 Tax=unclassified Massilia TaxID=2609279 RepID=UPI0006494941|nr:MULTISPECIES: aromatic-ring-hydroxylating dioxygenase subunit beta [unclassified Massilia]ALK99991.1 aromatic-ring-hydroxylating dioxygenase [Massilia sp. WG5]KLU36887.1 aromatic-ring-hydroxylating dioxygenase [Massilia sp. WF1]
MNELIPVRGAECEEIVSNLYREARLLDQEEYREWLKMVHADIQYQAFFQQLRYRKDKRYKLPDKVYTIDERHDFLVARIRQFETGMQWSVDPAERIRRFLSNVEVFKAADTGNYHVLLNVFVVRNRRVHDETTYSYGREEEWVRGEAGLQLLKRVVSLDQRFLHGKNLNFFL